MNWITMNQSSKVKFTYESNENHLQSTLNDTHKAQSVTQFNKLKRVHSYHLTNTIVKMKNKTNLFNNQLASNIKIQSF